MAIPASLSDSELFDVLRMLGQCQKSADPDRVHLDRLAAARRDRLPVDARVHPRESQPVGSLCDEPVVVHPDAEACACSVMLDDAVDLRRERVNQIMIARYDRMPADRVEQPRRRIDGVVFELARVGGVGEHPLAQRACHALEKLASLVPSVRGEEQSFVRRQRIARPVAEPRVAGDNRRAVRRADDEMIGGQDELSIVVVDGPCSLGDVGGAPSSARHDDLGRRRRCEQITGPCLHVQGVARVKVGAESSRHPHVLAIVETSGGFFPMAVAAPPRCTEWIEVRAPHAVRPFEHEAVACALDPRIGLAEPLAVRIPPRTQRLDLEPDGTRCSDEPVRHADGWSSMGHGNFGLDDHVADSPPPRWDAVAQRERLQMEVARRSDRAVGPLVRRQSHALIAQHENRVERHQADHSPDRWRGRDHEQSVIAPRAESADGPHRVAADAVGHQPLALGGLDEITGHLPSEPDLPHHHPQCWYTVIAAVTDVTNCPRGSCPRGHPGRLRLGMANHDQQRPH